MINNQFSTIWPRFPEKWRYMHESGRGGGEERIFQNEERCTFTLLKRFRRPSTMNQKRYIFRCTSFKFKNTQGKQKILKFTRKKKKSVTTGLLNKTGSWRIMTIPSKFWKKCFPTQNFISSPTINQVRTDRYIFRYLESNRKITLDNFTWNFWRICFINVRVKHEGPKF